MTATPSTLDEMRERYISTRRALGRDFSEANRALRRMCRLLASRGVVLCRRVTPADISWFMQQHAHRKANSFNTLLSAVYRFFRWLEVEDAVRRNPCLVDFREEGPRRTPVILSLQQQRSVLRLASRLPDSGRSDQRGLLFEMVFALLIGLGLRVGEAASLRISSIDQARRLLMVRGKFGKERLVPYGPKLGRRLGRYLRERFPGGARPEQFLFSIKGRGHVSVLTIGSVFRESIAPELGFARGARRPYVHDLRHTFAVSTLVAWYRAGVNVNDLLDDLSMFMGHVGLASTQVYLTVTAELLGLGADKFEHYAWKRP